MNVFMYFYHNKIFLPTYGFAYFYLIQITQHRWVFFKKGEHTQPGAEENTQVPCILSILAGRVGATQEMPDMYSNLLVSQCGTEMLLNVSLQDSIEMLEFPISNESYYVDLKKIQGISVWGSDSRQEAVFTWHN